MDAGSEGPHGKGCVSAALVLSVAYTLTVYGTQRQIAALYGWPIDRDFFVNAAGHLSPVILLLLMCRVCVFVAVVGLPVPFFFAMRMYYVWQFSAFQINSMAQQKGDGLGFLQLLFEMLSDVLLIPALFGVLISIGQQNWKRHGAAAREQRQQADKLPEA
jgi:hypothetical protein